MEKFNPEMLVLARESRALTQSDLADIVGITQGKISKLESSLLQISDDDLHRIAKVLNYPTEFFFQNDKIYGLGSSALFNRQRRGVPVLQQKQIQAQVNILRMRIERLLRGAEIVCDLPFDPIDIDEFNGKAEKIAKMVRSIWRLPSGPVPNLTAIIERAGGIVIKCVFGTRRIDAAHLWLPGLPPMFFINAEMSADRYRFTLAHELGHAIMHHHPTGDIEDEANRFAAEFLMPANDIFPHLHEMSIQRAAVLKPEWRVAMAALIKRARDLDAITERKYRFLFTRLSAQGYRTNEPIAIGREIPVAVSRLIEVHRKEHGYSDEQIRKILITEDDNFFDVHGVDRPNNLRITNQPQSFFSIDGQGSA